MGAAKVICVAGLLWCFSASVMAQEWVEVKDAKETRALLSNKTLTGLGVDGRPAVWYYREDGKGLRIVEGQSTPRTWEVKPDGTYCTTETDTYCFSIKRHATKRDELRVTMEPGVHLFEFHVQNGVPNF